MRQIRTFGTDAQEHSDDRFLGSFVDKYMSRHYIGPATEMLSVSLGKFGDRQELRQMALMDGDMLLHIFHLLQNPPALHPDKMVS